MEKLQKIQSELKAPKGQRNNFGNYNYRSCEDILEALKPLLSKHKCSLIIEDKIVIIGTRYYVKAIARLIDNENKNIIESTAYAREPEMKKGMDEAQITGATSSYARKYALNGLFAIDDTKDADSNEQATQRQNRTNPATPQYNQAPVTPKAPVNQQAPVQQKTQAQPVREEAVQICQDCGAKKIWTKDHSKMYCSNKCWLNKQPQAPTKKIITTNTDLNQAF